MSPDPSPRPAKYAQVAEALRGQINAGLLRPGDRLPSLGELCAQFETSLGTTDRALGILEREGLIVRVNGTGIFVADPTESPRYSPTKPFVALVIPFCHGEFFSPIIHAIQLESRAAGYHLIVANSLNEEPLEAQILDQLGDQTAGLLIMPCGARNQSSFANLLEHRIPFVLLDVSVEGLNVPLVSTDNERGGYMATRHLLESGCTRVYTIGESSARISTLRERIAGFRRALTEAGIRFEPSLIRQGEGNLTQLGFDLTKALLAEPRHGEKIGLFALNEHISPGAYLAIKQQCLRIPDDIAVVGFDDNTANIFDPPLTAVRQDLAGMGREGVRALVELMRIGGTKKPKQIRLQPELIVRNSTDRGSGFRMVTGMNGVLK